MKPEEKVELILWDWLKTKSKDVREVYFNRKNLLNAPTFKTKGLNGRKPDFLIKFNSFGKNYFIALEIKDGDIGRNIFNSSKIFDIYYKDYIEKKVKYFINDEEIFIDFFMIGSQFSIFSRLIKEDYQVIDNIHKGENDEWRKMSTKSKTLPRCEYQRTRDFLRNLWSSFADYRKKKETINFPALGILISDITKEFLPIELKIQDGMKGKPMILTMRYNSYANKKGWRQNYIYI